MNGGGVAVLLIPHFEQHKTAKGHVEHEFNDTCYLGEAGFALAGRGKGASPAVPVDAAAAVGDAVGWTPTLVLTSSNSFVVVSEIFSFSSTVVAVSTVAVQAVAAA